jgi:hypothetical protein
MMSILSIVLGIFIFQTLTKNPRIQHPDVARLAGLSRSFEPMVYFAENGVSQINELHETETAVWDLGESVRAANMTSAPIIIQELDGLQESLKTLAIELNTFFAAVNGDVDNILNTMEWAKDSLADLGNPTYSTLSSVVQNVYNAFASIGILGDPYSIEATPTMLDRALSATFGRTPAQVSRQVLDRAFTDLLSALEESINSELTRTASLFALFANIDQQFLNLQRATVRELDTQESLEDELLSSLWIRAVGRGSSRLKKYEKNKELLQRLRARTITNKIVLTEHNSRLMALKGALEHLRRRLVSPLIRGDGKGSTISIATQIEGLQSTHDFLKSIREEQRGRVYNTLFAGRNEGARPIGIEAQRSSR